MTERLAGQQSRAARPRLHSAVGNGPAPKLTSRTLNRRAAVNEVGRVLSRTGKAVYVIGENMLRGTYIRTSVIVSKLAELSGLTLKDRQTRALPANRRYMPPPSYRHVTGTMNARMRREVVLTFAK